MELANAMGVAPARRGLVENTNTLRIQRLAVQIVDGSCVSALPTLRRLRGVTVVMTRVWGGEAPFCSMFGLRDRPCLFFALNCDKHIVLLMGSLLVLGAINLQMNRWHLYCYPRLP